MSNMNTVFGLYNLTGPTSSTETAIAAVSGGATRATLGLTSDISGGFFDGKPFKIRVVSQGVASGACNFTVNIYANLGGNTDLITFTNDILVIGSGSQVLASKSGVVFMEAFLLWDSTLQGLAGFWNAGAGISNVVTTPAVIKTSNAVTATNPVTSTKTATIGAVQFFVTHTMSANPTSSKLLEFAIDRV